MKRSLFAAALMGIAFVPVAAHAQKATAAKPLSIGFAGGASLPTSDLGDAAQTGWNVTGTVGYNSTLIPLGLRADASYNRWGAKGGIDGHLAVTSLTGNAVYKFPSTTVSPYAIGGAGWCREEVSVTGAGSASESHFCWNAGGGISMPLSGFDTFIEARYNQVQENGSTSKFIPITFGVMF